ncbi:hypothetical protein MMC10_008510 [Thelotrema lepadinum]|nr:hypothetical protein [Thelotrema lepadinum]
MRQKEPRVMEHSAHNALRSNSYNQSVQTFLEKLIGITSAAMRPLPTQTGDGTYVPQPEQDGPLKALVSLNFRDVSTIAGISKALITSEPVDDRTYQMERIIQLGCDLPLESAPGRGLRGSFVNTLWNDLQHPPLSYMTEAFRYREADGSYNNIHTPKIGAANTPYARTVRPLKPQKYALPDPGVIFDSVLVRKQFKPHPTKISSMLFYLATLIIHDTFHSDFRNPGMNLNSSYLDLAPLYGSSQEEQNTVRTFKDGKLKPDCFASRRVLGFPPGVAVMLIMFNRWHNYIASQLASINENGRFNQPSDHDAQALSKRDHDLFHTARWITCGLYINIILKDYVRVILNLNRSNSAWSLDPREEEDRKFWGEGAASGTGNQVSAEFNCVYRWHTGISERDDAWIQRTYRDLLSGKDPNEVSMPELMAALKRFEATIPADPIERPVAGIKRNDDGTLPDEPLVKILTESTQDIAGAFGANNVPKVMRAIEILLMTQTRKWNLASLNEFRAHFNLKTYESFEEINPDPEVAEQLKHLYEHPDMVELYPGLVFEAAKEPMIPGSGLCPSFTTSRAVLADAVALVRGDRFYTTDYTPNNLTHWGFNECNYDMAVDNGAVFYKLILRAFPNHFKPNSVYAHFPFNTPWENEKIHHDLGIHDKYDYTEPVYVAPPIMIHSYDAATKILSDKVNFKVTWGDTISYLMSHDNQVYGKNFMLSGDGEKGVSSRAAVDRALYRQDWNTQVKKFYEDITVDLLKRHSYKLAGVNTVDIIRDVVNLGQAHFSAEVFCIPMKTEANPHFILTEREVYQMMAAVFACIFIDADPVKSFPLHQAAYKATQILGSLVEGIAQTSTSSSFLGHLFDRVNRSPTLSNYGTHMVKQLLSSGHSIKEAVWTHILPTAGGMVAIQGQVLSQVLDFYLEDSNKHHWKQISRLARLDTPEADDLILRYFMEGARIRSVIALLRSVQNEATVTDGEKIVHVQKGDRLIVNLVSADMDSAAFPEPEKVKLDRPMDSYIHYGWGPHECIGLKASKLGLSTMLKTIAKLEGLRKAPGPQGQLKKVMQRGFTAYLMEDGTTIVPFPCSMRVCFDGELPEVGKEAWVDIEGDGALDSYLETTFAMEF